jgi:NFU1 iron-sulfur cluster scaffold homolog, mitochondrial
MSSHVISILNKCTFFFFLFSVHFVNSKIRLTMAKQSLFICLSAILSGFLISSTSAFRPSVISLTRNVPALARQSPLAASTEDASATAAAPAPVLNGKRVLPYKIMMAGLKGHKISAVYAVLNASFQRGSEGWEAATCVGVSQDLEATLRSLYENDATELKVAHVRALSFTFPQPNAMQEVANQWREQATGAGAKLEIGWASDVLNYLFDDDDDDDDDEDDIDMAAQAMASISSTDPIISPFDASKGSPDSPSTEANTDDTPLAFNAENVDKVLNEVRPYLIADGGNVSVERVDEARKNVYLKLEGACGSCASSTVTMQMGIERVLKEKFPDMNEILQVDDDEESKPKELTWKAVEDEVNRLKPAIIAMGGVVRLLNTDAATGVVDIQFRGANKVQGGLELAILDVPFVNKVNFVMGDD